MCSILSRTTIANASNSLLVKEVPLSDATVLGKPCVENVISGF